MIVTGIQDIPLDCEANGENLRKPASTQGDEEQATVQRGLGWEKHCVTQRKANCRYYLAIVFAVVALSALIVVVILQAKHKDSSSSEHNNDKRSAATDKLSLKRLVIFGDSFSDTGNVYAASNGSAPAAVSYYQGRYSNGLMYPDFLSERLEDDNVTISNHAWGGATTDGNLVFAESTYLQGPIPAVNEQVEAFVSDQAGSFVSSNSTLYILVSGYNDYWWWLYRAESHPTQSAMKVFADQVSSAVVANMEKLYQDSRVSGRLFVVADLPPMTYFPEATDYSPEKRHAYQFLTAKHNSLLQEKLDLFQEQKQDATVHRLGVHDLYMRFLQRPADVGFHPATTNTRNATACLSGGTQCALPFGNLFWDDYHPTTHAHFLISQEILSILE